MFWQARMNRPTSIWTHSGKANYEGLKNNEARLWNQSIKYDRIHLSRIQENNSIACFICRRLHISIAQVSRSLNLPFKTLNKAYGSNFCEVSLNKDGHTVTAHKAQTGELENLNQPCVVNVCFGQVWFQITT